MYPRNAAAPEPIAIGAVIQISDGAVQTSGCTVRIKPIGVAEADGGGTTAYSTDGIVLYTPTQAETNYTSFVLIAKKTGCIPVSITIVTSAESVPGTVSANITKISGDSVAADNAESFFDGTGYAGTNNTIPTVTTVTTTTNLTNLPAITANWITTAGITDGAFTAGKFAASSLNGKGDWNVGKTGYTLTATTGLGNQTADITGNLSGSVGSVTGAVGSVTGSVGSVTGAVGSVTGAVGSVTAAVTVGTINANVVTASALATDAVTEIQSGLSTLTQANIRTAVGMASANLDTQIGLLATAANLLIVSDGVGFITAVLMGACADAGTAAETYVITFGGATYTADFTGLDTTGNRTTTTRTKT